MVWGDLENDKWHVSEKLGWNRGMQVDGEKQNSICHKNENCFTRQLTLHSIFLAETAHSLVWHWSPVSNLSKKIINEIFKTFQKALKLNKVIFLGK